MVTQGLKIDLWRHSALGCVSSLRPRALGDFKSAMPSCRPDRRSTSIRCRANEELSTLSKSSIKRRQVLASTTAALSLVFLSGDVGAFHSGSAMAEELGPQDDAALVVGGDEDVGSALSLAEDEAYWENEAYWEDPVWDAYFTEAADPVARATPMSLRAKYPLAATALATAPLVSSLFLQASGLGTAKKIQSTHTTGELSPLPFVSMVANSAIWSVYSVLIADPTCFISNSLGFLFGAYYTSVFNCHTTTSMRPYHLALGGLVVGLGGAAIVQGPDAAPSIGLLGAVASVILMASPLATIKTVIRDKSTESMPFAMTIASLANAVAWTGYGGLLAEDPFMWAPNGLGLVAACAQLGFFAKYGIYRKEAAGATAGAERSPRYSNTRLAVIALSPPRR